MLKAIRRHMNPATVMALLAMVFAMSGGAFAATSGLSGPRGKHGVAVASAAKKKKRKSKPTGKTGPRGPKGATGPVGPAGSGGPQGPAGTTGKEGAPGKEGKTGREGLTGAEGPEGKEGDPGESVAIEEFTGKGGKCEDGGAELNNATGTAYLCNGGSSEGSSTLGPGKTETGLWQGTTADGTDRGADRGYVVITYPIPLTRVFLEEEDFFFKKPGEPPTEQCPGSFNEPKAAPGFFCAYLGYEPSDGINVKGIDDEEHEGALWEVVSENTNTSVFGSWAMTAPEV